MENNVPDFQSIMYPVVYLLRDGKSLPLNVVMDEMAAHFKLTQEDLKIKVPSGQMGLFKNRLAWALSYLKNSGLIFYPQRGVYQITEVGKKALQEGIKSINITYLKKFEGYKNWQSTFDQEDDKNTTISPENESRTPEEVIGDKVKEVNNKIGYELLEILKSKPASYFEKFVLKLLSKMGYGGADDENFEVVGQSGDNGIDGIIYQDKLGIDRIYVQAKRWKDTKVQSKDIRDFIGSLSLKGTNKGVFITTSDFTADAINTVKFNPQNIIILINGQQLVDFAIENNVGVQVRKEYVIKDLDTEFFEEI